MVFLYFQRNQKLFINRKVNCCICKVVVKGDGRLFSIMSKETATIKLPAIDLKGLMNTRLSIYDR